MAEVKSKISKYQSLISKDEKTSDLERTINAVEESAIQMDSDIFKAKTELNRAKRTVIDAATQIPFNSSDVLEAEQDVEVLQDVYKRLIAMKAEYFG